MNISIDDLAGAIEQELSDYQRELQKDINEASKNAAKELSSRAKATAPKDRPKYARSITYEKEDNIVSGAEIYKVGAKGKQGRLTHLLAQGHAARDGGRVPANPFLQNAVNSVIPEFEKEVEKIIGGRK